MTMNCRQDNEAACPTHRASFAWTRGAVLCVAMLASGCIERYLTIQSTPPGAIVRIDGVEVGKTPIAALPYSHTGHRRVQLQLEGHKLHSSVEDISGPWYCQFPIDFVTELLIPYPFKVEHQLSYVLETPELADSAKLMARAKALRERGSGRPTKSRGDFSAGEVATMCVDVVIVAALIVSFF